MFLNIAFATPIIICEQTFYDGVGFDGSVKQICLINKFALIIDCQYVVARQEIENVDGSDLMMEMFIKQRNKIASFIYTHFPSNFDLV